MNMSSLILALHGNDTSRPFFRINSFQNYTLLLQVQGLMHSVLIFTSNVGNIICNICAFLKLSG